MATNDWQNLLTQKAQKPVYDNEAMASLQKEVQDDQGGADRRLEQLAKMLQQRQKTPAQRANPFTTLFSKYGVQK